MATVTTLVQIQAPSGHLVQASGSNAPRVLSRVVNFLEAFSAGMAPTGSTVKVGQAAAAATGTLTIASGSGTVGGTINGVAVTVAWTTSDTNTASLLAAAINASVNVLVAGVVTATSALGVVTLTAVEYGKTGNAITLAASGTGVTASGARLTGGAAPSFTTLGR